VRHQGSQTSYRRLGKPDTHNVCASCYERRLVVGPPASGMCMCVLPRLPVKSWLKAKTGRPYTVPLPVTTPSPTQRQVGGQAKGHAGWQTPCQDHGCVASALESTPLVPLKSHPHKPRSPLPHTTPFPTTRYHHQVAHRKSAGCPSQSRGSGAAPGLPPPGRSLGQTAPAGAPEPSACPAAQPHGETNGEQTWEALGGGKVGSWWVAGWVGGWEELVWSVARAAGGGTQELWGSWASSERIQSSAGMQHGAEQ